MTQAKAADKSMFARRAVFAVLFSVTMAGSLWLAAVALAPGGLGILDLAVLLLFAVTLLPYVVRMSGLLYLLAALALGGVFIGYALRIYLSYSDTVAQKTFRYSIAYLAFLFAALLVDHYL